MINPSVVCGDFSPYELVPDIREIRARLGQPSGEIPPLEEGLEKLRCVMRCRRAWIRTGVSVSGASAVRFGFGETESRDLAELLAGCDEAFVFGVTLGSGVDTMLRRLTVVSAAEQLVADALASACAEKLAEETDLMLREGLECTRRFSPGYGDLPLALQEKILPALSASETLGVTLTSTLLMTPAKSITAVMGIKR